MLHPDEAAEILEGVRVTPQTEEVGLGEALGRVLAGPVASTMESPPFDKAAMDGYAVVEGESAATLRLLETVAAGQVPQREVHAGECTSIMTGAMMPRGAGRVIRVEYTRERDGAVQVLRTDSARNVIRRGENLHAGQTVLRPKVLAPQDIGVLASLGLARVRVARAPLVGVITTGSELRNPGESLAEGQIYDSNGPQLRAQAAAMSCPTRDYGVAPDEPELLAGVVRGALAEVDVLLLSGGVSMGDYDHVPRVLQEAGCEILFHKMAIKPGKPTLFARNGQRFAFGLPGNPVSTFVIFELFVKPFLYRWMGLAYAPPTLRAPLGAALRRRDAERVEYRPVRLENGRIHLLDYHGSSHLNALGEANALVRVEQGVTYLEEGEELDARLL